MDDVALPPELIDGLDEYVPQLTLEKVPGATHWIVHEQPAFVAERLGAFIGQPAQRSIHRRLARRARLEALVHPVVLRRASSSM